MKNALNLLEKSIKYTSVSFVGDRIPMDPDKMRRPRSQIRMDPLPIAKTDL